MSRAEAESHSGWNCVPKANHSSIVLSMASTTPSGATGCGDEPGGQVVDRHVVHAVDADFAVAVNAFHERTGLHFEGMTMGPIHRIQMGQGLGQILGNMQEQGATLRNVEELHADADAEEGEAAVGHQRDQRAVEILSPFFEGTNRRMQHVAVAPGVKIVSTNHHDAIKGIQHLLNIIFITERWNHYGNGAHLTERVVVARAEKTECGRVPSSGAKVSVQADQRFLGHRDSSFDTSCAELVGK